MEARLEGKQPGGCLSEDEHLLGPRARGRQQVAILEDAISPVTACHAFSTLAVFVTTWVALTFLYFRPKASSTSRKTERDSELMK